MTPRLLSMLLLPLCCACSYVQYDGPGGRNVEIEVRNLSDRDLGYEVIAWRSDNRILWIEKEGSVRIDPLLDGQRERLAMRMIEGEVFIVDDGQRFTLTPTADHQLTITATMLMPPAADG